MSDFLLVAIDGTWSSREGYTGVYDDTVNRMCVQNSSYVRQFHRRMRIDEGDKYFHHGPESGITGGDSDEIAVAAVRWLVVKLRESPDAKIVLVGHSRGAHIVTQIAISLSRLNPDHFRGVCPADPPPRPTGTGERGIVIHFMGLYDAVDMTMSLGNTTTIPRTVVWFYHAKRSERVGSRSSWGNTATHAARRDPRHYFSREFDATHGSVGGAVPEGCESGIFTGCNIDLTQEQNRTGGEAANEWILSGARTAGLRFSSH